MEVGAVYVVINFGNKTIIQFTYDFKHKCEEEEEEEVTITLKSNLSSYYYILPNDVIYKICMYTSFKVEVG